ncbi:MAG: DEAD/DEAH box helicase [Nanoarchaeota archaeon]|nr:DEAD/DEAH box helicase [Nanoarchaeota archaeon]
MTAQDRRIAYMDKAHDKKEIDRVLNPFVKKWFFSKFKDFSLPQTYAVKEIHDRNNILVSAPTGGTKTLTAFLSILNELVNLSMSNSLEDRVYAVYISPLKALNNDIHRNLEEPLNEIKELARKEGVDLNIRIATRTGDTTPSERQKMLRKPPHILITTPESLALMLGSLKFKELMFDVNWCIIDEIHALADNKRGVHMALSLERLNVQSPNLTRIGLSATVEPIEEVARFLVGSGRNCKIAKVGFVKKFDLKVLSPIKDFFDVTAEKMQNKLYDLLDKLIQEHKTTLIFTNTRAGTERVVHHLKERYPSNYSENIGAHHGSLSKKYRTNIEKRLKEGKLKTVVCSTSLELGIDIGYIDLVICLGSPKGVARFLQRCLPYESRVLLADGTYKEIGEIVEKKLDVEILSYDIKKCRFVSNKISKYHKNKSKNFLEIKLHSGSKIRCTEEHPILTRDGWKKSKNLKKGEDIAEIFDFKYDDTPYIYELINNKDFYVENKEDFIKECVDKYIIDNKISYSKFAKLMGINQNKLQDIMRKKGRRKSIRLDLFIKIMNLCNVHKNTYHPCLKGLKSQSHHRKLLSLKPDKALMWLAGIVASDGCITKHKKTGEYKIKIGNKDLNILKKCQSIFNKYGFYQKINTRKRDGIMSIECGSKILSQIFISFGIKTKNKSIDLEVSNVLYKMPKNLVIPFIEGVLEGDGNVSQDRIRIFSASSKFISGLHNLLNRHGVHNYFCEQEAKVSKIVPKINFKNIYCLYVSRKRHLRKFLKYCIFNEKKVKSLRSSVDYHYKSDKDIEKNIHWTKIKSINYAKHNGYAYNLTLENEPNDYFVESILTHNCGRSGHKMHETVKGRLVVMDRDDLVECSVLLKNAMDKKIDRIDIPMNCLDVLAQQIHGMACTEVWDKWKMYETIKKSYCYSSLTISDFEEILDYLAGSFARLEERYVYAKIWYDPETNQIGKKGRMGRVIHMTNIGTIPDTTNVKVKINDVTIGTIDEGFLEKLKKGDIFVLGGNTYEFRFSRGTVAQVVASIGKKPTVPSWYSEMLPLSYDLASSIGKFRRYMLDLFANKKSKEEIINYIHEYLYVDENSSNAIYEYFLEQFLYADIPHDKKIIVEFYNSGAKDEKKYYVFHSLFGRRVNDVLSRAIAFAASKIHQRDIEVGINDNGFYLACPQDRNINVMKAIELINVKNFEDVMKQSIDGSEVLKRRFRHCAGRSMMILRNYKDNRKSVGRQQVSSMILMNAVKRISNDFCILKEARREVLEDLMDQNNAKEILKEIKSKAISIEKIDTKIPSPFAFNLVTQGYNDILRMEDKIEFIRRMHQMVLAKIGKSHKME